MNKIREVLNKMPISSLLSQTEEEIFQLIDKLMPTLKIYYPQSEYDKGMENMYKIIEKRIEKLKED